MNTYLCGKLFFACVFVVQLADGQNDSSISRTVSFDSVKYFSELDEEGGLLYYDGKIFSGSVFPNKFCTNIKNSVVNGKKEGLWRDCWRRDGRIMYEQRYKDGLLHGKWVKYHTNGSVSGSGDFYRGTGVFESYSEGALRETRSYFNGKNHGVWISWFTKNGRQTNKRMEFNWVNGNLNGYVKRWNSKGELIERYFHDDNGKQGWGEEWWSRTGTIKVRCYYLNNLKHGTCRRWHSNGENQWKTQYSYGKKDGVSKHWNAKGNLEKVEVWGEDLLIHSRRYFLSTEQIPFKMRIGDRYWGIHESIHGISLSLAGSKVDSTNGIGLSGYSMRGTLLNGVSLAPINSVAQQNGLSIGFITQSHQANGLVIGVSTRVGHLKGAVVGFVNSYREASTFDGKNHGQDDAKKLKGLAIGLYNFYEGDLQGVQMGLMNYSKKLKGLSLGVVNQSGSSAGIQIGVINQSRNTVDGAQVGVFNKRENGTGLQLGLLNFDKQRKRPFRLMPIIGF